MTHRTYQEIVDGNTALVSKFLSIFLSTCNCFYSLCYMQSSLTHRIRTRYDCWVHPRLIQNTILNIEALQYCNWTRWTKICISLNLWSFPYTGEFGIVYKGVLTDWNDVPMQGVAVKTLKGDSSILIHLYYNYNGMLLSVYYVQWRIQKVQGFHWTPPTDVLIILSLIQL